MNLRLPIFAGLLLIAFSMLNNACKKPSPFGFELHETADLDYTDTITLECTLVREDSVITSDKSGAAIHFLCGEINDPVLGKYSSDIYTLMQAVNLNPQFDTSEQMLDSIVLYLKYSPSGVYGDTLQAQTLKVLRLSGTLSNDSSYYSNAQIAEGQELGRLDNFLPKPSSTDSLFSATKGAFLRVKLDDSFGTELMQLDSLDWQSDSAFYKKLRGLKIVSAANGATPGAMLAFDLNDNSFSRVALYYRIKDDTIQKRFDFFLRNANKFTHFDHSYAGSEVEPFIGNQVQDKMYLQGMQGLRLKISFPYANLLNKVAVNKAQLVLTVADDDPYLVPANQLVFTESFGDTVYNFTSDVLYALGSTGNGSLKTFGGFPEKEFLNGNTTVTRYRMTMSEHFQHIIDDDAAPDIKNRTIYVNVYPRNRQAQRAVLYGPGSIDFPAKLELKYTRVE